MLPEPMRMSEVIGMSSSTSDSPVAKPNTRPSGRMNAAVAPGKFSSVSWACAHAASSSA